MTKPIELTDEGRKELAKRKHELSQQSRRLKEAQARYELRKLELIEEAKRKASLMPIED
jgi:DNA-binding PadR family transcriptional regulator